MHLDFYANQFLIVKTVFILFFFVIIPKITPSKKV